MNKTFETAMTAIMDIESVMKKKKSGSRRPYLVLLCLVCLLPLQTMAITKDNADTEYKKGNYQQAIKDYQELLRHGQSADLYYNLGNSYYRTDNLTRAIICYERASLLSPGDADIRFNLRFARNKTIDKIVPETDMFFSTWYQSMVNFTSIDTWAVMGVASIVIALVLVLCYLFASRLIIRKVGFYGAAVLLLVALLCNIFASQQKYALHHRTGAIVVAPTVNVKKTPALSGTDDFVIHEGTRVDITDRTIKGWYGVKLADGREGWMRTSQLEEI